jgi:O-antigen ligase
MASLAATAAAACVLAALGFAFVAEPRVLVALIAVPIVAGWAMFTRQRPASVLRACFLLVLIAGTKFRDRDAWASLDGSVDLQIAMELGIYGLVGVAALVVCAARHRSWRKPQFTEIMLFGYVSLAACSTLWSVAPAVTLVRAAESLTLALLAIAAARELSPSDALRTACSALIRYVLVCSAIALLFSRTVVFENPDPIIQFTWFAVHPITAASLLGIAALAVLHQRLFSSDGSAPKYFGVPASLIVPVLLALQLMTRARGPMGALLAAGGVLLLKAVRLPMRLSIAIGSALAAVAIGGVVFLNSTNTSLWPDSTRPGTVAAFVLREQTPADFFAFSGRLDLWTDLVPLAAKRPLFGYGYQASRALTLGAATWAGHAHNAALQTQLDLGVAGFVLLAAIVATGMIAACQSSAGPPNERVLPLVLTVFLIVNSVTSESFAGAPGLETMLVFLGALASTRVRVRAPSFHVPTASVRPFTVSSLG